MRYAIDSTPRTARFIALLLTAGLIYIIAISF